MSRRSSPEGDPMEPGAPIASAYESGVLIKDLADVPDRAPPWSIVEAYLSRGEHRYWVEGWAARSPAFADVLAALRNDHEEREAPPPRRPR